MSDTSPDGFSQASYRKKNRIQYHESISSQLNTGTVQ